MLLLLYLGFDTVGHADAESFFASPMPRSGDTVIVDLKLPGMSGAQVIKKLQDLTGAPRIIVISAQSQAAITAELRGIEAPILLRKPLSELALAAHLVPERR